MKSRTETISPENIRTIKLLKYFLSGKIVCVEGINYFASTVLEQGDGASVWDGVDVSSWTIMELKALADMLEGQIYSDVMNFK